MPAAVILCRSGCNDSRTFGTSRSATVTSPGGNSINFDYNVQNIVGGKGQCAVGTFIADGPSQSFTIQSATSAQLNALQLRSIPVTNFTVSVNATQAMRTVDSRVFGINTALYDSALPGNGTIPLMTELGVRASRWPGGSYGDTFLISTEYLRESWQARTTNFINIVKTIGADSFIIANYGTGTPQDAADFVQYVNITQSGRREVLGDGQRDPRHLGGGLADTAVSDQRHPGSPFVCQQTLHPDQQCLHLAAQHVLHIHTRQR